MNILAQRVSEGRSSLRRGAGSGALRHLPWIVPRALPSRHVVCVPRGGFTAGNSRWCKSPEHRAPQFDLAPAVPFLSENQWCFSYYQDGWYCAEKW